jgi:hypothetical protein
MGTVAVRIRLLKSDMSVVSSAVALVHHDTRSAFGALNGLDDNDDTYVKSTRER